MESISQGVFASVLAKFGARVLGLLRTVCIAAFFGANVMLDHVDVCQGVLLVTLFLLNDGFELYIIPRIISLSDISVERSVSLARSVLIIAFLLSLLISLILIFGTPFIFPLFVSGYSDEALSQLRNVLICFLPGAICFLPIAFLSAYARALRKFRLSFRTELIISFVMLISILAGREYSMIVPTSYSLGQVVGLCMLGYALRDSLLKSTFSDVLISVFEAGRMLMPGLVKVGLLNLAHIIYIAAEKNYGSYMPEGSLAAFSFSTLLFSASLSAPSIAPVIFTELCEGVSSARINYLIRCALYYSIPTAFFLILTAPEVAALLFGRGKMSESSVHLTGILLAVMSLRLTFEIVEQIFYRMFFIQGRTNYLIISRFLVNLCAAGLMFLLLVYNVGPLGLAIHFVLQGVFLIIADSIFLSVKGHEFDFTIPKSVIKLLLTSICCAVISFMFSSEEYGNFFNLLIKSILFWLFMACTFFIFVPDEISRKLQLQFFKKS